VKRGNNSLGEPDRFWDSGISRRVAKLHDEQGWTDEQRGKKSCREKRKGKSRSEQTAQRMSEKGKLKLQRPNSAGGKGARFRQKSLNGDAWSRKHRKGFCEDVTAPELASEGRYSTSVWRCLLRGDFLVEKPALKNLSGVQGRQSKSRGGPRLRIEVTTRGKSGRDEFSRGRCGKKKKTFREVRLTDEKRYLKVRGFKKKA